MTTSYQKIAADANVVRRISDGVFIPIAAANKDYVTYATYAAGAGYAVSDLDSYS